MTLVVGICIAPLRLSTNNQLSTTTTATPPLLHSTMIQYTLRRTAKHTCVVNQSLPSFAAPVLVLAAAAVPSVLDLLAAAMFASPLLLRAHRVDGRPQVRQRYVFAAASCSWRL